MSRNRSQNAELWTHRIEKWRASGLSQKKWCEQNSIAPSSLQYWLSRALPRQEVIPLFTEVVDQLTDSRNTGLLVRIGTATIEVAMDFDEETLQRLVKTLGDKP